MDIEGVAYDMGSVVSGEPECCVSMESPSTKQHIEIVVDLGYGGGESATTIDYRSVGIVNLVSTLQAQGYMIDLYIMSVYPSNKCMHRVKINTDTFCVAQLASCTTTEYWRGLGWITVEIMRNKKGDGGCDGSKLSEEKIKQYKDKGVFYIGGGYTDRKMCNLKSGKKATDYIIELFNKFCNSKNKKIAI